MIIYYASRNIRLGGVLIAATERGICFLQFHDRLENLFTALEHAFPDADIFSEDDEHKPLFFKYFSDLEAYFEHKKPFETYNLHVNGTAFQKLVWNYLATIPFGETRTYSDVARAIKHPKAVRAVGSACGKNLISILIPCHRVVAKNGSLGGYRWGIERKNALLKCEKS